MPSRHLGKKVAGISKQGLNKSPEHHHRFDHVTCSYILLAILHWGGTRKPNNAHTNF
jgi:hypothetical protein